VTTTDKQTQKARSANRKRGAATRRAILDAAAMLFAKSGWRGTGLPAVGEAAGVSHAAVHYHFGTADGLLLEVLAQRDEMDAARFAAAFEAGGLDGLRALEDVAVATEDNAGLAKLYLVVATESIDPSHFAHEFFVRRNRRLRRALVKMVDAGKTRGEIRSDADAKLVASRVMAFMDGATLQQALDPERVQLRELYAAFLDALVRELACDGGDEK
jgi:AcrR family transcriptional regulator